jgi:hypothetical protein
VIGTAAGGNGPTLSETRIAHAVAGAARSLSGIADVSPGLFVEAATYGPGETVRGVVVRRLSGALSIELHLRALYSPTMVLPVLADRLRDAVRQAVSALGAEPIHRIDVAFDDLHVGED